MVYTFPHLQYAHMVFIYGSSDGAATAADEEYHHRFSHQRTPSRKVLTRVFNNFAKPERFPVLTETLNVPVGNN